MGLGLDSRALRAGLVDRGITRSLQGVPEKYSLVIKTCSEPLFKHSNHDHKAYEMGLELPEVRFVHAVTAGGSVKFLPAVYISPETTQYTK